MSAKSSNHFLHYILIVLFASGIVAIAAEELHNTYRRRAARAPRGQRLVQELRGQERSAGGQAARSQATRLPRVRASEARAQPKLPWSSGGGGSSQQQRSQGGDSLSSTDRSELNQLLSHVGR